MCSDAVEDHQTAAQECYDLYMAKHPEARPPVGVTIDKNFDTDAMDNILYKDGLDWTCEKPKDGAKYSIIYIIDKEEEE